MDYLFYLIYNINRVVISMNNVYARYIIKDAIKYTTKELYMSYINFRILPKNAFKNNEKVIYTEEILLFNGDFISNVKLDELFVITYQAIKYISLDIDFSSRFLGIIKKDDKLNNLEIEVVASSYNALYDNHNIILEVPKVYASKLGITLNSYKFKVANE